MTEDLGCMAPKTLPSKQMRPESEQMKSKKQRLELVALVDWNSNYLTWKMQEANQLD
jgi:hypothetical protein